MGNTIDHFMWGYQSHFRALQAIAAKELLKRFGLQVIPDVFLVGILVEDRHDRHPACVDPEKDYWIVSSAFNDAKRLAVEILPTYPEAQMFHSHPLADQLHNDNLTRRSIQDAILKILEQNSDGNQEFFISVPQKLEGYYISVVLTLPKEVVDGQRHLHGRTVSLHEFRNAEVSISLLDASISELLAEAADQLTKPEPGRFVDRRDTGELIRAAGQRFMLDIAFRADSNPIGGFHGFFSACNAISSLMYEKSVGHGRLILARKDHPAITPVINFTTDLRLSRFRGARKLLELASHGLALHSNSDSVFSLVRYSQEHIETEDLFIINFLGHYHWEVTYNDNVLMRVQYEQPYLPKASDYESRLEWDIPRTFPDTTQTDINLIKQLVKAAESESHGTMLLISSDAKNEANRLSAQATLVEPVILTPDLLPNLTPIDGAVLLDQHGCCYAIGVILDGMATNAGDTTRGARYNSALRYVKSTSHPCLAVVVSEDGGVDLLPNLRPPVRRETIENYLSSLIEISSGTIINRRQYFEALENVSSLSFYFSADDCCRINEAVTRAEGLLESDDPMAVRIVRSPFEPNPEMNQDLYYQERIEQLRNEGFTNE